MYTFYVEYEEEKINIVNRGLTFEEARKLYAKYAGHLYKRAGSTWQNNIAFFEDEDADDSWRFEGYDINDNPFFGGFYPEEE